MKAAGNGSEGAGKDRSNVAGPGGDVQGSGTVGALVQQQELGDDGGGAKGPGGVPPPGDTMNYGADGETWGRRRVGVPPGSGGNGSHGDPPHR